LFILRPFTDLVTKSFGGTQRWSLLGVIFLPLTTLKCVLVVGSLGPTSICG
jgi:hypothetical protein